MSDNNSITIQDLTDEEQQMLVGLLMIAVNADLDYTPEETDALIKVGDRLGRDRFIAASAALRERLPTPDAILGAVPSVERAPARALIYELVEEICAADGIADQERKLLDRLIAAWDLPPR